MVSNQNEFNNRYSKKTEKVIRIRDENNFEGSLVIESYPNLEKLYLRDIDSINKLSLSNLSNLQEVTIWNCGTKELIIENCSQIKILNIRSNSLTNLDFLLSLENLEELDLHGNTQLIELLKPYNGDWKIWKKVWEKDQQIALLQREKSFFISQEQQINYLETRVQELTNLIKTQKEKIIGTFLRLLPEKELVQQLIMAHFEFIRFKKQAMDAEGYEEKMEEYEEKCWSLKKELRKKIDKETMNEVRRILVDCEELVRQELELETKLTNKFHLISEHKLQVDQEERETIEKQKQVQYQQLTEYKKVRNHSIAFEIEKARLEGRAEAFKEIALETKVHNYGTIIRADNGRIEIGDIVTNNREELIEDSKKSVYTLQEPSSFQEYQIQNELVRSEGDKGEKLENYPQDSKQWITSFQDENEVFRQKPKASKSFLSSQVEKKKTELEQLINMAKTKLGKESEFALKTLVKVQINIVKSVDASLQKSLASLQDSLSDELDKRTIEEICQKQKEIVQLEQVNEFIISDKFSKQDFQCQIQIPPKN